MSAVLSQRSLSAADPSKKTESDQGTTISSSMKQSTRRLTSLNEPKGGGKEEIKGSSCLTRKWRGFEFFSPTKKGEYIWSQKLLLLSAKETGPTIEVKPWEKNALTFKPI